MEYHPKIGDLVWAKMKSYPSWPARVVKPGANAKKTTKKDSHLVYFFGSNNYGWIDEINISPYEKDKHINSNISKSPALKAALDDIESYILQRSKDSDYETKFEEELHSKHPYKTPTRPEKKAGKTSPTPVKRRSNLTTSENSASKKAKTNNSPILQNPDSPPSYTSSTSITENGNNLSYTDDIETGSDKVSPPDVTNTLTSTKTNDIVASKFTFGFMGLGGMGSGIVKNMIEHKIRVNLWNRTPEKCDEIKTEAEANSKSSFVQIYLTPTDVVQNSDIIISCLSGPQSAKEIVIGKDGVVHGATEGTGSLDKKGYVEMTSIDPQTSHDIASIIKSHGGRYLEVQLQGSKTEAIEGSLILLAAGDQSLFNDCAGCFKAIGKTIFYLGDTGYATKMSLCLNVIEGVSLAGLVESMILAERSGLSIKDFLEVFNISEGASDYLSTKGKQIMERKFLDVEEALKHMQKNLKLSLDMADNFKQNLPVTSAVNEIFKIARRFGYDNYDISAIFMKMRH